MLMTGFSKSNKHTITTYETPSTDTQQRIVGGGGVEGGWDGKLVDKLVNLPEELLQDNPLSCHCTLVL